MLLQSLLLVVTLALIGSTLLTSTLVSAKSAFHEMVLRQSRSAMTDATALLISWAQDNVRQNGIDQLPVWAAKPQVIRSEPVCRQTGPTLSSERAAGCNLYRTLTWNISGYTEASSNSATLKATSEAKNLATAQGERRISATLNVAITDRTGTITYARQSREITARAFHAFPYVAITAERDASSESGSITTAEGDTAGFLGQDDHQDTALGVASLPDEPSALSDTTLITTIDCANIAASGDSATSADSTNNFTNLRTYGSLAWSYEAPCIPEVPVNLSTAPKGYQQPISTNYGNRSTMNDLWTKGDDSTSTFAH